MLIRFAVKNLFSFWEETEFNLLPGRTKRLNHHKYQINEEIEVLKLTALYGANGSGKSNLIRSISLLKRMLTKSTIPNSINAQKFKLSKSAISEPVELSIEFFTNSSIYYYSVAINEGIIIDEYFSSLGPEREDMMIFHRKSDNSKNSISFFDEFESKNENRTLKKIIETDLLKPNQPLFSLLNTITNDHFIDVKTAYTWLDEDLTIIYPETKASGLVIEIDSKPHFKDFAVEVMESFNTGISNLKVEIEAIDDFFGKDNEKEVEDIKSQLKANPEGKIAVMANKTAMEDVAIVTHNGEVVVKRLLFEHLGQKQEKVEFKFAEESDGTRRLLEYLPALNDIANGTPTYIIDEIERSIHPLIVKEIIDKFSKDALTKGQLIFSTHESNLLDQEIFRPDEIWFAEKNVIGATKLYSLSDFKEHSTIDIRKGYLGGRYGAIPFLGNLHDLNWHKYQDETE
ncbi:ATP-binding protein [Chitinophaga filiformis]|uniref:AAA family ATPase n=1 Tax=Chitinophaga filiformis TaxID=104663 RepID=UPI001F157692|nr:ATP-binding protein [Chitinophaga filiformis]MCF6404130.1 ATP-binding protein [Chitinophaga filiformis]